MKAYLDLFAAEVRLLKVIIRLWKAIRMLSTAMAELSSVHPEFDKERYIEMAMMRAAREHKLRKQRKQ